MSRAVIAVVALFYAVGYWNAFFNAILYINDNAKWPLQLVLRSYVLQGVDAAGQRRVGQVDVAPGAGDRACRSRWRSWCSRSCPILVVYPFVQRHFTKGVIFGAIKG